MELKEAMEAATAELDVRPGFVGDVMAGGRRRHTRKLLAVTAAVALLAGVTTGVVLTRSSPEPVTAADARLTAPTSGDLSTDSRFIEQTRAVWAKCTFGRGSRPTVAPCPTTSSTGCVPRIGPRCGGKVSTKRGRVSGT